MGVIARQNIQPLTIPEIYNAGAVGALYDSVNRDVTYNRVSELNGYTVLQCLAKRVAYIASAVLILPVIVFSAIDTYRIVTTMRKNHAAWATIAKVEWVYFKMMAVVAMQWVLNILLPELMLTNTFDFRNALKSSATSFFVHCIHDVDALCSTCGITAQDLPDQGAALAHYREECFDIAMRGARIPNYFEMEGYAIEVINSHYTQDDIRLARMCHELPILLAIVRGDRNRILQLVHEGADLAAIVDEKPLFEILETRLGSQLLKELLQTYPLEREGAYPLLLKLIDCNKTAYATVLLDRLEQLSAEQQPEWWKMPIHHAELFMQCAARTNKELATKFVPTLSRNASFDQFNKKTAFMVALEKGWKDLAYSMLEKGLDLSCTSDRGKFVYEYVKDYFGEDVALRILNFKDTNCEKLLVHLINRREREYFKKILIRITDDATLLAWQNKRILSLFYLQTLIWYDLEVDTARNKILPYVDYTETTVDRAWNYHTMMDNIYWLNSTSFGIALANFDALPITNYDQTLPLLTMLLRQRDGSSRLSIREDLGDVANKYIRKLLALPREEKARWATKSAQVTSLFAVALEYKFVDLAKALLPYIDVAYENREPSKTVLMVAAEQHWDDLVLLLVKQGALLHAVDQDGVLALEYIVKNCTRTTQEALNQFVTKEYALKRNSNGKHLFSALHARNLAFGFLSPAICSLLASYRFRGFGPTTTVGMITTHLSSKAFFRDTSSSLEQKGKLIELFFDDAIQVRFFNLLSYQVVVEHMRYAFARAHGTVAPLPSRYNYTDCINEILTFINPIWPDHESVHDDHAERTKVDIVRTVRAFSPVDNELNDLYGHVMLRVLKLIRNQSSLSKEKKQQLQREVKQFVQSFGVTLHHCSDRQASDGRRYYVQFVEGRKRTLEEDEQTAIQELVHEELLQLRRTIFREAYFSVDTDMHDVATQRYIENICNTDFGLHLPELQNVPDYRRMALRDRVPVVQERFRAAYNPCRIANHLQGIVAASMRTPQGGRGWYAKLQAFLENKHPNLNWNEVFDLEANTITPKGLELLLVDLAIVT